MQGSHRRPPPTLLTIAGGAPTSGAGLAADLQVFRDFGFHGLSIQTAAVDQGTSRVGAVLPVTAEWIGAALRRVIRGGAPSAIKIGLLARARVADRVAEVLSDRRSEIPVVVDPVFHSDGGAVLTEAALVDSMRDRLLPLVSLLTPNVPEATRLVGMEISDASGLIEAGRRLCDMGARAVLVKGGHLTGAPGDALVTQHSEELLRNTSHFDWDVHGTGCHLSSAIAALLGRGLPLRAACIGARQYLATCIACARRLPGEAAVGEGRGLIVHGSQTQQAARDAAEAYCA